MTFKLLELGKFILKSKTLLLWLCAIYFVNFLPYEPIKRMFGDKQVVASPIRVSLAKVSSQKSIWGSYIAGRFAEKQRDFEIAANLLDKVLKEDAENDRLIGKTFLLFLGSGKYDRSLELAEKLGEQNLDKRNSATMFAQILLAARAVKTDLLREARERLQKMPNSGLEKLSKPIAIAWVNAGLGEFQEAFSQISNLSEESGFGKLADLHLALLNESAGRHKKALAIYQDATANLNEAPVRFVRAFGSFLVRNKQIDKARELYTSYLTIHPGSYLITHELERLNLGDKPSFYVNNAVGGFAEGMFNLASALPADRVAEVVLLFARIATYLRPDFPKAQLLMGNILDVLKRYNDSIEIYKSVEPNSPYSWLSDLKMAENLNSVDRINEARALLQKLANQRPKEIQPLMYLGNFLRKRKDFIGAERAYNRAFERLGAVKPDDWELFYYRGICRERQKKWRNAEKDFLRALELNPNQPYVLNYLGYSWVDQGRNLDKARAMIELAVEQRRDDGYIVDSMGWVLYRLGQYVGAVKHLESAVELRPLDPIINDHLGDAYWRVGRKYEARFQWKRALSFDPEIEEVRKIRSKIENGLKQPKVMGSNR